MPPVERRIQELVERLDKGELDADQFKTAVADLASEVGTPAETQASITPERLHLAAARLKRI